MKAQSYFILYLILAVLNYGLLEFLETKAFEQNFFSYETAFEDFRDGNMTVEIMQNYMDHAEQMGKEKRESFEKIAGWFRAMWSDAKRFPVGKIENAPGAKVRFANSWKESRTFGGDRFHEGCDIMASVNERGIYPIYSVSDGVVEKIGWLNLGGYRIGIRSQGGAYFYYAHLSEYAEDFEPGEEISAGTLLGFMGDTGYSDIEGTTGNFPVHLHFGIYFTDEKEGEFSVNPYPLLFELYQKEQQLD